MKNQSDVTNIKQEGKHELKPKLRFPEFRDAGEWSERGFVAFRLRFALIDPKFCNYLLNSGVYQYRIKGFATRAVCQANINPTAFQEKLIITIPPPIKQQKIADCLSSLDDLITAQAQKIELLKRHKKGLMQQLFPMLDEVAA